MGFFSNIINTLTEGELARRFGPDFLVKAREAQAQALREQEAHQARMKETGLDIESKGLGLAEARTATERKRKLEAELARRAGAGEISSEYPEVGEMLSSAGKEKRATSAEERAAAGERRTSELFPTVKAQGEAELKNTQNQFANQLALARERAASSTSMMMPVPVTDEQGNTIFAARGNVLSGGYRPPMTAEQRNQQYQGQAVDPAFDLVEQSLDTLERTGAGVKAIIPGTDAYYAKRRFVDQAKALLGAIVARQAGEGSRLSDEDRRSYSQAATLVNNSLLLPGGITEARARIQDARRLLQTIQARRAGGGMAAPSPSGGLKVLSIERVQ